MAGKQSHYRAVVVSCSSLSFLKRGSFESSSRCNPMGTYISEVGTVKRVALNTKYKQR